MSSSKKNLSPASVVDAVKQLLASGNATTQESICLALSKQNIQVNQSKVSRLLRKLGAIKILNPQGEAIYSLPSESLSPPPKNSQLEHLVLDITANESMIVIHTDPGSASLIARLLDHQRQNLQILGTLAGDDALFVVPTSVKNIKKLTADIQGLLGS